MPEMFRTNFMVKTSIPVWNLLNQIKSKTTVKSLKQIQDDQIIMDFAKPVLFYIEKAYLSNEAYQNSPVDPMLRKWHNVDFKRKNLNLKIKIQALVDQTSKSIETSMNALDDKIESVMTRSIQASWLRIEKSCFEQGPIIVCFPKCIEEAVRYNLPIDPSIYDETPAPTESVTEPEIEVVHSQSLFPIEEEEMETVHIVAVSD